MEKQNQPKDTKENKVKRELKLNKKLDFFTELYDQGIPLEQDKIDLLKKYGRIEVEEEKLPKKPKQAKAIHSDDTKTEKEKEADSTVDIVVDEELYEETDSKADVEVVTEKVYSDMQDDKRFIYTGGKTITKEDWLPKDLVYHTKEFVAWIDSINSGFQRMVYYKPFQMYCQQSKDWMSDKSSIYDFESSDQRREWAWSEMERISDNSLYFLDKYLHVKEATYEDGYMDYESKPVHKVMAYLFDCGYSIEMGKPRQIAATTTVGGLALCKLVTKKNFFIKMIAQDKEKVIEIFDDKIKYPFSELPEWMDMEVLNDRDNLLYLGKKNKKGKKGGVNSKIQVVAPTVSAINGGAPPLVLIDEGGYIGILGKMIKEARPTMFMQDHKTKKITMKRQIWIWGTGGEMDKKGKAYEEEFKSTIKKWQDRDFENGIIPIFFDWTTRPGITKRHYEQEKRAYSVEGPDQDEKLVQFRQTYPSIIEDMFLTSSKTLIPISKINERLEHIRSLDHDLRAKWGYFEPIYDTSSPSKEHDDLPFKLIGAEFIRTERGDPRASCKIFKFPERNWRNRYYIGVDPIHVDNGYSNMASAVWDAQMNTISAVVNYRHSDHKQTFLQNLLLSLYYDVENAQGNKKGAKMLVEGNIGTAFTDYVEYKGYRNALVLRTELEPAFQGGNAEIGIDNRANRTKFIIHKMHEFITLYRERIYIEDFWNQLTTFVCKVSDAGNETWETQDKRKYHDDVLFAAVFAYICSISFDFRLPDNRTASESKERIIWKGITLPDGTFTRVPVKKQA
ncbi:MAG: hypothetical protein ACTSW1_16600 [Candidatus Hodarchaeales archaeon]